MSTSHIFSCSSCNKLSVTEFTKCEYCQSTKGELIEIWNKDGLLKEIEKEDNTNTLVYVIISFLIGMAIGSFFVVAITNEHHYSIEQIQKGEQDCLIKEYYYLDEHRDFCDKLGVKP